MSTSTLSTSTPTMSMTMLGTTRSGKSTYLLGMYATLSAGLRNYFVYTQDPDQDLDLSDAWDLLCDNGELPPPNAATDYRNYAFVFNHGITPLISIDCADYRGGALNDRESSSDDVGLLQRRLENSDTIYLVLDGDRIGDWLAGEVSPQQIQRQLRVGRMSQQVQRSVEARRHRGLPAPSIVLLITKADVIREKNGPLGPALHQAANRLEELVPVAYQTGVAALICPVQIGRFGSGMHERVDVSQVDPVGLHRPLIFSLMHFLTEGIEAHQSELADITSKRSEAMAELNRLRSGFMGGLFRRGRIGAVQSRTGDLAGEIDDISGNISEGNRRIAQLAAELDGQYVVVDGKLTR